MKFQIIVMTLVFMICSYSQASLMPENPAKLIAGVAAGTAFAVTGYWTYKNLPSVRDKKGVSEKVKALSKTAVISFSGYIGAIAAGAAAWVGVLSILNPNALKKDTDVIQCEKCNNCHMKYQGCQRYLRNKERASI